MLELLRLGGKPLRIGPSLLRGWNMLRVDGERGAWCEITPPTADTIADVRRKFVRLEQWAKHFGIETRIPVIIEWLDSSDHKVTVI